MKPRNPKLKALSRTESGKYKQPEFWCDSDGFFTRSPDISKVAHYAITRFVRDGRLHVRITKASIREGTNNRQDFRRIYQFSETGQRGVKCAATHVDNDGVDDRETLTIDLLDTSDKVAFQVIDAKWQEGGKVVEFLLRAEPLLNGFIPIFSSSANLLYFYQEEK